MMQKFFLPNCHRHFYFAIGILYNKICIITQDFGYHILHNMPLKRKTSLTRYTKKSKQMRELRTNETEQQREQRLSDDAIRRRTFQNAETEEQRENRLSQERERIQEIRDDETTQRRHARMERDRTARLRSRRGLNFDIQEEAFNYDPAVDYHSHSKISIGNMDVICSHCHARKFKNEAAGMCCCSGKVSLASLREPPEPLNRLTCGTTVESKLFLQNIRKYNSCFQLTSFGATKVVTEAGYMPTFKIQGQVYHKAGSLLPDADKDPKFLQIYFTGNSDAQIDQRCNIVPGVEFSILNSMNVNKIFITDYTFCYRY